MKEFVPIADDFPLEMLALPDMLVPYRFGFVCYHALAGEGSRQDTVCEQADARVDAPDAWCTDPVTA